nr:hypothetical protein BaRGS_018224 [Batillaria attramentaria]
MDNVDHTADISSGVTYEKREDVRQTGQVARLHATVNGLKAKLFTVLGNEFQVFGDKVETTAGKLQGSKRREKSRMCEAGTVTLAGFNRAEYIFQSEFEEVPGVLYSVTGLKVNLNALATPYSPDRYY